MSQKFLSLLCGAVLAVTNALADNLAGSPTVAEPQSHPVVKAPAERRVPAEWEPQEAIWLQWPGEWEKTYEEAFAAFSCIIIQYEKLHVLYQSPQVLVDAKAALITAGCSPDHELITWHDITAPYSSRIMGKSACRTGSSMPGVGGSGVMCLTS